MKILLWPLQYLPLIGGIEVMTHTLALQLQKEGHEILVITGSSNPHEFKEFFWDGIKVHTFPFTPALFLSDLGDIRTILKKLDEVFGAFNPDVVNVHGWFESASFFQVRALKKRNIPLCITVHGLLEQVHYHAAGCQTLWKMASAVSAVSQAMVELIKKHGFDHPHFRVIHNGLAVSAEPIHPLPPTPKLVMIGRLTPEKGFDVGFQALKIVLEQYPDLQLRLVGGGGEYPALSDLRDSLGLVEHIEMTDFVRPNLVREYLDRASIVWIPSFYESFSLVALEAALRARPVIATDVLGLKEVVENGVTGILVEPNSPKALARATLELLSQPEKIEEMGRAARKRAQLLFSIENTTQNYLQMYRQISKPLVSIVIPTYNGEKYLAEAIGSILSQSYSHYEIWVVDNGSTDQSKEVAQSFQGVHYRYLEKADTAVARNFGISLSRGDYIAFLDQDDTWAPDKLQKQVAFLEEKREFGAVIGQQMMYLEPGQTKPHWLKQTFLEAPQAGYLPSALMVRRTILEQTKKFNADFPFASDVAWFLKAKHQGISIGILDEVVVYRRIHGDNTSHKCLELQKEILGVLKHSLRERREKNG